MTQKILAQAAEAIILQDDSRIIKRRIAKGYRIKELDEKLRKLRTRSEAKIMLKLADKINVPKILNVNEKSKEITMQFINGKKLSETLESLDWKKIAKTLAREIAKIHDADLIHGDLTTSNMIYVENSELNTKNKLASSNQLNQCQNVSSIINSDKNITRSERARGVHEEGKINNKKENFKIFFIDFGLGFHSSRIEDKAVDLHLLKQALEAKHFTIWQECFKIILDNYESKDKVKILEQLKKVEARGRYKH